MCITSFVLVLVEYFSWYSVILNLKVWVEHYDASTWLSFSRGLMAQAAERVVNLFSEFFYLQSATLFRVASLPSVAHIQWLFYVKTWPSWLYLCLFCMTLPAPEFPMGISMGNARPSLQPNFLSFSSTSVNLKDNPQQTSCMLEYLSQKHLHGEPICSVSTQTNQDSWW